MAISNQVDVSVTATKVVSASSSLVGGGGRPGRVLPVRYVTVKNLGAAIAFLGGDNVTPDNGIPINVNGTFNLQLSGGDEIWACTASGSATISYIETGGG